jgi:hypothetical protein
MIVPAVLKEGRWEPDLKPPAEYTPRQRKKVRGSVHNLEQGGGRERSHARFQRARFSIFGVYEWDFGSKTCAILGCFARNSNGKYSVSS